MMFLLTQEERDELVPHGDVEVRDQALWMARALILTSSGFRCIHDRSTAEHGRYCDDCPVHTGLDRRSSRLVCTKTREYSK